MGLGCSTTIRMMTRVASLRNAPEGGLVASRICSRDCGRLWLLRDAEHQLGGDLAAPDLETALHRAEQSVRVAVGIGGLETQEQFAPGLRRVRLEPGPQVVGDCDEGIRATASALRLQGGLCRRSNLTHSPSR